MRYRGSVPPHGTTGVAESIDTVSAPQVNRGEPRDAKAAAALARYDRIARLPLVLSALLPLVIAPEPGNPVSVVIGIVSWLVFVVDFVVHESFSGGTWAPGGACSTWRSWCSPPRGSCCRDR